MAGNWKFGCVCVLILVFSEGYGDDIYDCDASGALGRRFDGIGAISGGGATSKLLVNYPEPQRSQILDFLFKPNFGASLHIFKVEIGGDAQSTEGTESSHMHNAWDEDYTRGYEWWMMTEAKKRNPDILLYGLPWGFPGWVSKDQMWAYENPKLLATYVTNWVKGAKDVYNLTMDYLGIWNEKPYEISYVKELRKQLNDCGHGHVKLVVADLEVPSAWKVFDDMAENSDFRNLVDFVGIHYPQTLTPEKARASGKPLWSSEDASSSANEGGAGRVAKELNRNYQTGLITSTIVWNILAAYYSDLPCPHSSLMLANEPWSSHYEVTAGIWAVAHTTQFSHPGWDYLPHGKGVHKLLGGGTMVSFISPDKKHFTIVIETMEAMKVPNQKIQINLKGSLASIAKFQVWHTKLGLHGTKPVHFENSTVLVKDGIIKLSVGPDEIYTITTLTTGRKGTHPPPPPSKPFPVPYKDNFDSYAEGSEASNLAQQVGAFEVSHKNSSRNGGVLTQVVLDRPVHWCPELQSQPATFIGNFNWTDIKVTVDAMVPSTNGSSGIVVGARVTTGGCYTFTAKGVYVSLLTQLKQLVVATDLARTQVVFLTPMDVTLDKWYHIEVSVKGNTVIVGIDGKTFFNKSISQQSRNGFVALASDSFGLVYYDNLLISNP